MTIETSMTDKENIDKGSIDKGSDKRSIDKENTDKVNIVSKDKENTDSTKVNTESKDKVNTDKPRATETYAYDVEMNNLMSIIINSMYSSKEYFLRELISNCSDACDKLNALRQQLRDKDVRLESSLRTTVRIEDTRIIVEDNGIGMTKADLIEFLGCVANSGTRKFREALKNKSVDDLIGQFGLGFYASFLVADRVSVQTRFPGEKTHVWTSSGLGQYFIEEAEDAFEHGTRVVLHIKEGCKEFLKKERIKELIKKYSMFLSYPIMLRTLEEVTDDVKTDGVTDEKTEKVVDEETGKVTDGVKTDKVVDVADEKTDKTDETDKVVDEETGEVTDKAADEKTDVTDEKADKVVADVADEKTDEGKSSPAHKQRMEWKEEQINKEKPLWSMKPKEISREMYSSFYKTISNDWDDYLAVKHSHLEGSISFDILLFAPKRPRFNMLVEKNKKHLVKLYCNSVFVTDDLELPDWMQCVVGVISSRDLPMNVSREFLQGANTKKLIRKTLSKKTIELLKEMDKETFDKFYAEFSSAIKLAVRDENETALEGLLRFNSNKRENISLDDYVRDMAEGQAKIYIITGTTKEEVAKSPFLGYFRESEVIFMIDSMDEYLLQRFRSYKGKEIEKINQEGVEIPDAAVSAEVLDELKTLKEKIEGALADAVEKVEFLNLGGKHMLVRSSKYGMSPAMEKILAAQVAIDKSNMFMFPKGKKILQINVSHPLTFKLNNKIDDEQAFGSLLSLLFKVACVQCGYSLEDPVGFSDLIVDALLNVEGKSEKVVEEEEVH